MVITSCKKEPMCLRTTRPSCVTSSTDPQVIAATVKGALLFMQYLLPCPSNNKPPLSLPHLPIKHTTMFWLVLRQWLVIHLRRRKLLYFRKDPQEMSPRTLSNWTRSVSTFLCHHILVTTIQHRSKFLHGSKNTQLSHKRSFPRQPYPTFPPKPTTVIQLLRRTPL